MVLVNVSVKPGMTRQETLEALVAVAKELDAAYEKALKEQGLDHKADFTAYDPDTLLAWAGKHVAARALNAALTGVPSTSLLAPEVFSLIEGVFKVDTLLKRSR